MPSDGRMDVEAAAQALEALVFEPDSLTAAFDRVADALDLRMFHLTDISAEDITLSGGTISMAAGADYAKNSVHLWDTWMRAAKRRRVADNRLVFDHAVVPHDLRRLDPYYQTYCREWDINAHCAWSLNLDQRLFAFTLIRDAAQGDFSGDDKNAIARLMPVANRTALMLNEIRRARGLGLAHGIEQGGRPSMLIDQDGHVAYVSPSAEALFGSAFGVQSGVLWARDEAANAALAKVCAAARQREAGVLCNIIIPRTRRRPLVAMPSPVRGVGLDILPGARILLVLVDLDAPREVAPETLRDLFGLTPSEALVASLLAAGRSAADIAVLVGVRASSVRQTIKAVFAKTHTHRQQELIALLARLG